MFFFNHHSNCFFFISEALIVILEHYIETKCSQNKENDVNKTKLENKENILPRTMNESNNCNETKTSSFFINGEKENIVSSSKDIQNFKNSTNRQNSQSSKDIQVCYNFFQYV